MKYKHVAAVALGLAFSSGLGISSGARAETALRLLNAFDNRYAATTLLVDSFVTAVKEASKGDIQIRTHGPEVVPPFEQVQPVRQGAFDLLHTNSAYYIGVTSVSHGIQGLEGDPVQWRQLGIFDYVDKDFQRLNLKLLAIVPTTTPTSGIGAFQGLLKEPIRPGDKPLAGRKIRGTPTFQPMLEAMGASMVFLSGPDTYPALQRGTVEGVFWPVIGAVDFKWYEVAPYMMRPTFGGATHMLLMNLTKFNSLSPDQQKILLTEGQKQESSAQKSMEARVLQEIEELKKRGVKETVIDPNIAAPFLAIFKQGFWQTAENAKATPEEAKAFHAFARSKGLAK
jgi:TRAP-type C4-dicarboxylate transport system substrate-binding protein